MVDRRNAPQATEHANAGRKDEALTLFEKAVESSPNAPAALQPWRPALHCKPARAGPPNISARRSN